MHQKPTLSLLRHHRQAAALIAALLIAASAPTAHAGSEPYLGEMMLFAPIFPQGQGCPQGWLQANGAMLPISSNTALYSLLGTTYGGNGQTTFQLPDMRGRVPVGQGQGQGMQPIYMGAQGGTESITLLQSQLPAHVHAMPASPLPATHATPAVNRIPAQAQNAGVYGASDPVTNVNTFTGSAGNHAPVSVRDPYLAMNWCIAVQGIFPSSN